jgi:predicted signal transduction protein with EAL and GGDEF domain
MKCALKHLDSIFTIDIVILHCFFCFLTVKLTSFTKYALCLGPLIALFGQRE